MQQLKILLLLYMYITINTNNITSYTMNYYYYYDNDLIKSDINNIYVLIITLYGVHKIITIIYNYYKKHINIYVWILDHLDIITTRNGTCTICLEPFNLNLYKTKCNHIFHIYCLRKWINTFKNLNDIKCPNCNNLLHYK